MHQTFTGSSRRPRQVNLSGRRNTNPFASVGTSGPPSAVARAQVERERRHREQDKERATKLIQRHWRGYHSRKAQKQRWRQQWDHRELSAPALTQDEPGSEEASLSQLTLLLRFASPHEKQDLGRLRLWLARHVASKGTTAESVSGGPWPMTYLRLQKLFLAILDVNLSGKASYSLDSQFLFDGLRFTIEQIPDLTAENAKPLYRTLAACVRTTSELGDAATTHLQFIILCALSPLQPIAPTALIAYEAFACEFLTLQELSKPPAAPRFLDQLADNVNYKLLANAIAGLLKSSSHHGFVALKNQSMRAYTLAHLIYFYRRFHRNQPSAYTHDKDYLFVISTLLPSVAFGSISQKTKKDIYDDEDSYNVESIDPFIQEQVLSLVDGDSISRLLGTSDDGPSHLAGNGRLGEDAKQLASFALTLLRFFPRRADDIRIQLYRGSATNRSDEGQGSVPAIRYFWEAMKSTPVFNKIHQDIGNVVSLIKLRNATSRPTSSRETNISGLTAEAIQDQWRVILVFFELYAFVLRLMDDEEFFSPQSPQSSQASNWASQNALPLEDVSLLTIFLKNLGFSMVFNAFDLSIVEEERSRDIGSISNYFSLSPQKHQENDVSKPTEARMAGVTGISIDYVKDTVTGLLRMLYERDSRRPFLPKDHWLMTSRLDMDSFISAVVDEDEKRHRIQEEDETEYLDDDEEEQDLERAMLVGTGHSSRLRQQEKLRKQQRRHARTRFLAAVAPRLEILQNMPFFIPFETRVQIFREFVKLDQLKRRGLHTDPDMWRHGIPRDQQMRHHARIRREHIFEDAVDQFYALGEGLKEPIQITFVDSFDNEEAGIDGGGVTKEFLTSITKEAFTPSHDQQLFIENDNHLLYPNPAAVEEVREASRRWGGPEEARQAAANLLNAYEFLGRIIGKCMYEGILVDVNFAGFFLLKWALTGGEGFTGRESNYRANLNDLRDLDEALYQGLLKLKNYPGDVSDFGQDFTIVDTIVTNHKTKATKNIVRELKPNGADIPVTNENRLVYISYVARYRLQVQPFKQTTAFLRGLSSMIKPSWLSMFNQAELQTLIGGTSSSIDISDLRQHTQYGGVYVIGDDGLEHPTITLFWDTMQEVGDEERRAVLKFVTSTPRAPLLGFASLMPRFSIRDSGSDQTRLPSTSTCVNLLKLPMYQSKTVLRDKLLQAVHSGAGFDLS